MSTKNKAQCQPEPEYDEYTDEFSEEIKAARYLANLKIKLATAAMENLQAVIEGRAAPLKEKPDTSSRDIDTAKSISSAADIPLSQLSTYMRTLHEKQSLEADNPADTETYEDFIARLNDSEDDLITNYEAEVRAFYEWVEINPIPSDAQCLWHLLLSFSGKYSEMNEFSVPNSKLLNILGCSRDKLIRMRKILAESGRISYRMRSGRQTGYYTMNHFMPYITREQLEKKYLT